MTGNQALTFAAKDGPLRLSNGIDGDDLQTFFPFANSIAISERHVRVLCGRQPLQMQSGISKRYVSEEIAAGSQRRSGTVIRLSPDEQLVAAGSQGNRICVWNVQSAKSLHVLTLPRGPTEDLQFSPDGTLLATIDPSGAVTIWDLKTGQTKNILRGHGENTPKSENSRARTLPSGTSLAFLDDGDYIVSAGKDETLRLWHVDSGREVGRQLVPTGHVWKIDAPRGSDLILTGGEPFSVDPLRKTDKPVSLHLWRLLRPLSEENFPGDKGGISSSPSK